MTHFLLILIGLLIGILPFTGLVLSTLILFIVLPALVGLYRELNKHK